MTSIAIEAMPSTNGAQSFIPKVPFVIGVAGGTASGKSTVCKKIMEKLGQDSVDQHQRQVVCISQDSFYRELNEDEKAKAFKGQFNFDHPDAFDHALLYPTLKDILAEKVVHIPKYDFKTNARVQGEHTVIYPADVVLLEGILVFYYPEIRDLFHMKLFVDTDPDTRLSRRVLRDINERGRDLEHILQQYTSFVKPAFEEFCLPTKKYADVIIPRGADNTVAIDLIVQHIKELIKAKLGSRTEKLQNHSTSIAIDLIVQHIRDLLRPNHGDTRKDQPKRSRHYSETFTTRPH